MIDFIIRFDFWFDKHKIKANYFKTITHKIIITTKIKTTTATISDCHIFSKMLNLRIASQEMHLRV